MVTDFYSLMECLGALHSHKRTDRMLWYVILFVKQHLLASPLLVCRKNARSVTKSIHSRESDVNSVQYHVKGSSRTQNQLPLTHTLTQYLSDCIVQYHRAILDTNVKVLF